MPSPSFGRRFLALIIDWAIALLSVAVVTEAGPWLDLGAFFVQSWLLTGLLGFTIGKRVLDMKVEGIDGRPIGLWRSAIRTGLLCLVVPAILQNSEGRGLHDVAARSRIVRIRSGSRQG